MSPTPCKPADHLKPRKAAVKKDDNLVILPSGGKRNINIDHDGAIMAFTMDFDDAELLRKLLDLENRITAITESTDLEVTAKLDALLAFSGDAREVVDQAFGAGSFAQIFGDGHLPIVQAMSLVSHLARLAGPAFDAMFAEYRN